MQADDRLNVSLTFLKVYELTVEENMAGSVFLGMVSAVDKDLGNNASIRYSLEPPNSGLTIDANTGEDILYSYMWLYWQYRLTDMMTMKHIYIYSNAHRI